MRSRTPAGSPAGSPATENELYSMGSLMDSGYSLQTQTPVSANTAKSTAHSRIWNMPRLFFAMNKILKLRSLRRASQGIFAKKSPRHFPETNYAQFSAVRIHVIQSLTRSRFRLHETDISHRSLPQKQTIRPVLSELFRFGIIYAEGLHRHGLHYLRIEGFV